MFIVHGVYRFAPKLVAYRNDWCNQCDKPVLAQQWRCFYVGHLFWIPVLPLGFHKNWRCQGCTNNPRRRHRISTGVVVAGLLVFSLMFAIGLAGPYHGEGAHEFWALRVVFGGLTAVFGLLLKSRLTTVPRERNVEPLRNDRCLVCGGRMTDYPQWHCADCGVIRYDG
jgi:hypothetical protein